MRGRQAGLLLALAMCGCDGPDEVVADRTRPLTMRDRNLTLDADNGERFQRARQDLMPQAETPEAPVVATEVPASWETRPTTAFRLIHYGFGTAGEVYVSVSRGGLLENVNRWLGQFGETQLGPSDLAALERVEVAGYAGVWVEAEGDFAGGMGRPAQESWALRGVVAERDGAILTVKMLGPEEEVRAESSSLTQFVAALRPRS